ncbi:hypothetical protein GTW59_12025 [Streptomyces sp. SID89]|nr:hypothetical protein [Streptomyces sp. SID89]
MPAVGTSCPTGQHLVEEPYVSLKECFIRHRVGLFRSSHSYLNQGALERAGNSVEVLLTRYAKCLDGRQDVADRRIEDLLREYE